ncbi:TadE family protein [Paenibacillus agaridevorans]|uniref:TadE family protein n=1 Tax=Paenibacillus agaridevorans TaxID=171404 RepID=UPI001BE4B0F1|nr:TadE family protein [Paenibacillus agaridevorans]
MVASKAPRRWVGRTEQAKILKLFLELRGRTNGSIVVEAAIVLPLLIFLLMAFALPIMLCTAQMALHETASQTARSLASHIYPAELAVDGIAGSVTGAEPSHPAPAASKDELPKWNEVAAEAAEWLPGPAGELASSALRGDWGPLVDLAATELGRGTIEPLARRFAAETVLRPERLRLAKLMLPDLVNKDDAYLTVVIQYEFPVRMPLLGKKIVLKEQVRERVWISDAVAAAYGSKIGGDGNESPHLQIVSITPTPLRPGQKATVTVLTNPGQPVSLGVMYKSGASKAKHLGDATADGEGFVSWTWHVSGNTTPGIWKLTVTAEGEHAASNVSKHFLVEKRNLGD